MIINKIDFYIFNLLDLVCFIYNIGYFLNKCRFFCMKLMVVRKKIFKDKGICFKCCVGFYFVVNCLNLILCEICKGRNYLIVFYVVFDLYRW